MRADWRFRPRQSARCWRGHSGVCALCAGWACGSLAMPDPALLPFVNLVVLDLTLTHA